MDQRSKIAILGYGVEGRAMFKYLKEHGYHDLTICDINPDLGEELPEGVSACLGPDYLDDLEQFDAVFRSPGIKYLEAGIQSAKAAGVEISSVTRYFVDQCPCPIIGVTGTKGKGTTCTLIYNMLKKAGRSVYLGGNIGKPAVDFLDDLRGDDLVVLEMSSFQLQDLTKSPRYGVFLNTTSDHLDYHEDHAEYMQAKEALISHQHEASVAVLNRDYTYYDHYRALVKGELLEVSKREKVKHGAYVADGKLYAARDGESIEVMNTNEIQLPGVHNLDNAMPATAMAVELEVDVEVIAEVLREFRGLPHRLQFGREVEGVKYYNDSNSTNAYTSMAAAEAFEMPTVMIAGGSSKGVEYDTWAQKILTRPNLNTVVLIGAVANEMQEALHEAKEKLGEAEGSPTKILRKATLKEALESAREEALRLIEEQGAPEAVVVLSPAAASFDMFRNYVDRGVQFMELVQEL